MKYPMAAVALLVLGFSHTLIAKQVIDCPVGSAVRFSNKAFAKLIIDGEKITLKGNQTDPEKEGAVINETLVPGKSFGRHVSYISGKAEGNDHTWNFTVSLLKEIVGVAAENVYLTVLAHRAHPNENDPAPPHPVKFEGCESTVQ